MTPFREKYEEIWAKHISSIQAAGTTLYAEHRLAKLQKARREIAENSKTCKDCGTLLSESDREEFTDLCIGCYIWHT